MHTSASERSLLHAGHLSDLASLAPDFREEHLLDRRMRLTMRSARSVSTAVTPIPISLVVRAVTATTASTSGSLWPRERRAESEW
jgi:hypothetical protein